MRCATLPAGRLMHLFNTTFFAFCFLWPPCCDLGLSFTTRTILCVFNFYMPRYRLPFCISLFIQINHRSDDDVSKEVGPPRKGTGQSARALLKWERPNIP